MSSLSFFFYSCHPYRYPPSFPTRRSSDLCSAGAPTRPSPGTGRPCPTSPTRWPPASTAGPSTWRRPPRSEEHTSELQSRRDLVCRLLLEKKKNKVNLGLTLLI